MGEKNLKLLSPKLDVVFQKLFGEKGSENITKGFVEAVLNKKLYKIDLDKNPILRRENLKGKLGILDIVAKVDEDENLNIELQILPKGNEIERILYYWARLYTREIQKGEKYQKLKRTIVIMIADFEIEKLKELNIHSKWQIVDDTRKIILTKKLEIHIIELLKIYKMNDINNNLLDWLTFIEYPERSKEKMGESKSIKEAREKLKKMSQDEEMQRIAEWREDALRCEKDLYDYGINNGRKEGKIEGKIETTREIAKKMLEEKIDIKVIEKVTGLTESEIKNIQ